MYAICIKYKYINIVSSVICRADGPQETAETAESAKNASQTTSGAQALKTDPDSDLDRYVKHSVRITSFKDFFLKNPTFTCLKCIYKSARLTFYHSSDDELTPYDMSGDQEISKASPPRYLRDCLESMASPISSLFALCDHLCRILTPACPHVSNLSSFNILWGPSARGALFESCWEFGAEEQFCSQRGTTGITEALRFEYFLWKIGVKLTDVIM